MVYRNLSIILNIIFNPCLSGNDFVDKGQSFFGVVIALGADGRRWSVHIICSITLIHEVLKCIVVHLELVSQQSILS